MKLIREDILFQACFVYLQKIMETTVPERELSFRVGLCVNRLSEGLIQNSDINKMEETGHAEHMDTPLSRALFVLLSAFFTVFRDSHTVICLSSGLKIGEILIQGDLPIIEYRRKRAALQSQAEQQPG